MAAVPARKALAGLVINGKMTASTRMLPCQPAGIKAACKTGNIPREKKGKRLSSCQLGVYAELKGPKATGIA